MPREPEPRDRRPRAVREAEQRRSRRRLILIILTAIVVPIAATFLFIGSERARGFAVVALAVWFVVLAFFTLFQRPIPKSQQSPVGSPPTEYSGFQD